MKSFDVVTVGSALKDIMFYSPEGVIKKVSKGVESLTLLFDQKIKSDNVHFGIGGGASNTAVNFKGLGLKVSALVSVGKDEEGDMIINFFKKKGIDTSYAQRTTKRNTGFSFLFIHEQTRDHVVYTHYGAAGQLSPQKKDYSAILTKWWYVTSLNNNRWTSTMKHISSKEGKLAWNPGGQQLSEGYNVMVPYLEETDILFLNKPEAIRLVQSHNQYKKTSAKMYRGKKGGDKLLSIIQGWGPELVVITDGREAIFAKHGEAMYYVDPPKDQPEDTTGAGDSFGSTFVAVFHKTGDVKKSLKAAMVNTTSVVSKVGAQAGFIRWAQLKKRARI